MLFRIGQILVNWSFDWMNYIWLIEIVYSLNQLAYTSSTFDSCDGHIRGGESHYTASVVP